MEAWIANANCPNFKSVYERYELYVSREIEGVYITQALNELVNFWRQGALEPKEHEVYFVNTALPKIATRMVRTRYLNETLTHNVYFFIRKTIDIAIELMPLNMPLYSDFLVYAFDHSSSFFSSKNLPPQFTVKFPHATIPAALPSSTDAPANADSRSSASNAAAAQVAAAAGGGGTSSVSTSGTTAVGAPENTIGTSDNATQSSTEQEATKPEEGQSPAAAPAPADQAASPAAPAAPTVDKLPSLDDEAPELNPYASVYGTTLHYPSQYFPDLLNFFGALGGFHKLLQHIGNDTTPIAIVSSLLHALRNSCMNGFLFARRIAQFTPKVLEMAPITKGLSTAQLKAAKKEELENMLRHLGLFLKISMPADEVADRLDQLGLRIAAQCLSSGILTQRLFALNFLGSAIDAVLPRSTSSSSSSSSSSTSTSGGAAGSSPNHRVTDPLTAVFIGPANAPGSNTSSTSAGTTDSASRWLNIPNLVEWIRGSQILANIFGDSSHSQLLKNSGKLMRFLSQYDGLTVGDVELIWKCGTNSHESLANDALTVFFDIAGYLAAALVEPIVRSLESSVKTSLAAIAALDPNQRDEVDLPITPSELHNIASLANRLADASQRMRLVHLLLTIVNESPVRLVMDTNAHLIEIFKSEWFRPHRLDVLSRLLKVLQDDSHPTKSFYCALIDPIVGTWTHDDPTTPTSLAAITAQLGMPLEDFLIEELVRFKETCRPLLTPETYGYADGLVLAGCTTYLKELQNRLYLLYHIYIQGQGRMTRDAALRLWDCLYQGAFNFGEAEEAAEWFKAAAAPGSTAITPSLADQLFQARLVHLDFTIMSPGLYTCFERFFIHSNVEMQNMVLLQPKAGQPAPAEPDFEVSTHPDRLVGESCLWDIALTNPDASVVQACMKLLIKCMEQLDPALQLEISPVELREHFISKCLDRVPDWVVQYKALSALELSSSNSDEEHRYSLEKFISNSLSLLVHLMDSLEPAASKRSTVTRGIPMSLRIQTALEVPTPYNPGNVINVDFVVACESSTTFSALQALVASRLAPLLKQHRIAEDDLIYLQSYPWYRRLDRDVSVAEASLSSLELYDRDAVRVLHLPSTAGRETLLRARKGNAFKPDDKARPADAEAKIQQICEFADWSADLAEFALKTHSWDVEQVGNSIMDESRRSKLLNDAKKAGIGKQQQDAEDGGSPSSREIAQIMKQRTDSVLSLASDETQASDASLPSFILSSNKTYFDALFNLLTLHNDTISNSVWQIVLRIPTSVSIKASLLTREKPNWSELLPLDVYRLFYTVQIIDQILCPLDDSWQLARRMEWAQWFQETGGVNQLFKVVSHFETEPFPSHPPGAEGSPNEATELPLSAQTRRDCLTLTLKILDVFLSSYAESLNLKRIEEVSVELSSLIIENEEDADDAPKKPALAPQESDLRAAYTAHLKATYPVLLPADCHSVLKHLQEVLAWSTKSKPQVANGALVSYAWRCFVNLALSSFVLERETISPPASEGSKATQKQESEKPALLGTAALATILDLLTDLNPDIRRETAANMLHMAMLEPLAASALLRALLNSLPPQEEVATADLHLAACYDRFYWLLEWVIKLRISMLEQENPGSLFGDAVVAQFGGLVERLTQVVHARPVVETGAHSYTDHILNGSIRVLAAILRAWPTEYAASEFITVLYHGCMFTAKSGNAVSPKCKTHTSRTSTYELLLTLARLSDQNKLHLLTLLSSNHSGAYSRMQSWDFHPGNEDKSATGYVGLVNLGATCYMNSLLQQFYMMPTLRRDLLAAPVVLGPEETLKENMVYQFHQLMGNLQETAKAAHNPKEFTGSYRDIEGNPADVNLQQDVSEFFNIVCGTLETLLKGTADEKLLQRNLGCVQVSQIKSMEADYPFFSEREEELYAIPLDVRLKNNFNDAMDMFVKQDMLEGDNKYKCEEHGRHIVATKGNLIKTMSNTLIFHLMRFDFDVATYRKRKLNEYFNFPMRINMKKWTKAGQALLAAEQAGVAPPAELAAAFPEEYFDYQLTGILVHTGSADSGHYYSFIKERDAPGKWYQFNDRVVSEFDPNAIAHECFGGYHSVKEWDQHLQKEVWHDVPTERSAYMLFYERVVPTKPDAAPVAAAETAAVLPGNRRVLRPTNYVNGVPSEVHTKVWDENANFLKVRQIFDPAYFEFMRDFAASWNFEPFLHLGSEHEDDIACDSVVTASNSDRPLHVELQAIKTIARLTFEIIAHSKDNLVLTSLLNQLSQMLTNHVPATVWFLEYLRRHNLFKELMLSCHIERSRIAFQDFFRQLMQAMAQSHIAYVPRILAKGSNGMVTLPGPALLQPAEVVLITTALDLLEESRGAWRRFKQYFGVIRDFALLGTPQRQVLLKKGVISLYVDYFMGQSSGGVVRVRVMDEDNFPDLVEFIDTVTLLVRSCKNENPSSQPANAEDLEANMGELASAAGVSDAAASGASAGAPSGASNTARNHPRSKFQIGDLELPAASKNDMYEATDFFTSLLEMDYNSPSTGDMLEYICWYVPSRTDYVLDHLLTKIDVKPSENKAPVLEYLLYRVLSIDDDLRQHRIERVMGKKETPSSLGKGYLGSKMVKSLLLLSQSQHNFAMLYMVGYLRLVETLPACFEFVLKNPIDLLTLRKFWRQSFETQFPNVPCDSHLINDAQNGLHRYFSAAAELVHPRHPSHPRGPDSLPFDEKINALEPWKRSVPYLALVFCTLLSQHNGNTEPAYEDIVLAQEKQILKLASELESLKKERKTLAKALMYVHDTYPTAKLQPKLQMKVEDIISHVLFSAATSSTGGSGTRIINSGRPITAISYLSAATGSTGTGGTSNVSSGSAGAAANSGAPSSPGASVGGGGGGAAKPSDSPYGPATQGGAAVRESPTSVSSQEAPTLASQKASLDPSLRHDLDADDADADYDDYDDEDGVKTYPPREPRKVVNGDPALGRAASGAGADHGNAPPSQTNGGAGSDSETTMRGTLVYSDGSPEDDEHRGPTPRSSGDYDEEAFALMSKPSTWRTSQLMMMDRGDPFADDFDRVYHQPAAQMWRSVQVLVSQPVDWEDRINSLKAIGMIDNDELLKLLLQENSWSVESAANDLFDPDTIQRLQKKMAKIKADGPSSGAGSDTELDNGEVVIHHH
jgi:ubiquitin C-terminal hydrolase